MEIADIKSRLSLSQVLQHYNLQADKNSRMNCPFHDDKTPSMQVYHDTHTVYCFSSNCKTHGKSLDVIDFIMHKEGLNKHEAITKAKALLGQPAAAGIKNNGLGAAQLLPASGEKMAHMTTLQSMFSYFRNAVCNSAPAKDYLKSRGLDPVQLEIGYNTGQFHHGKRRDLKLIEQCVSAGLLTPWGTNSRKPEEQAYKVFGKNCICFAMKDKGGSITGLYFRSTADSQNETPAGASRHFYLKGSTGLYPEYPSRETRRLIITESIIDCASLLQIEEITNQYTLLTAYGTNRLNDEIQQAIQALPNLEEITFAFDSDQAGREAVKKYSEMFNGSMPNVSISTLDLPDGEDVNSLAQGHESDIFQHLIDSRTSLFSAEVPKQETKNETPVAASHLRTENKYKLSFSTDTAVYFVQGGIGRILDNMKITLVIEVNNKKSRNKVDLYEDKQVEKLCKDAAQKLGLERESLESDISTLTDLLDEYREQAMPADDKKEQVQQTLTAMEREKVEAFLKQQKLIYKLNELLGKSGIAGEVTNRIFLLIIAISYKMAEPLHALIQGSSGSGKTRLLRQISDCMPPEQVIRLTRVSDKGFYNYPENYLTNKLMSLEDVDGLGEEATFAFRELQSNGELNSATSIKLENGQIVSGEKRVRGPIASLACTTQGEIYEDNMSRVFLIAVDEGMEQTKRIITYQNRRASGGINEKEEKDIKTFIQQIVRELKPYKVVNPFASKIQLPEEAHKIRRLNDLFQSFVRMVTVISQLNRKKDKSGRLITELEDIETAIDIMFESIVLKVDELDGSLRQFFERLKAYLQKQYKSEYKNAEFTQREVRQAFNLSKAQCSRYFAQLSELEYIRTKNGNNLRKISYRIDYWDNYSALRKRISDDLKKQVESLYGNSTEQ